MEEQIKLRPVSVPIKEVVNVHSEESLEVPDDLVPEAVNKRSYALDFPG